MNVCMYEFINLWAAVTSEKFLDLGIDPLHKTCRLYDIGEYFACILRYSLQVDQKHTYIEIVAGALGPRMNYSEAMRKFAGYFQAEAYPTVKNRDSSTQLFWGKIENSTGLSRGAEPAM